VIGRNVEQVLPYMMTENVLMAAVAVGKNRQEVHEAIRRHSHAVTAALKAGAARNDLLDRLRADPLLEGVDFQRVTAEGRFVGRAPEQVDELLAVEVEPIRQRYRHLLGQKADIDV
jgi:adenylosuccinate lyase